MGGVAQLTDNQGLPMEPVSQPPIQPAPAQPPVQQAPPPPPDTQREQHGFFHALRNVASTIGTAAFPQVQRQKFEEARQQEEDMRRRQNEDLEYFQHAMEFGAKPVVNNTVKRAATDPSTGMPIPGTDYLDKAGGEGRQVVNHKTADGRTVQYELPTWDEQITNRLRNQYMALHGAVQAGIPAEQAKITFQQEAAKSGGTEAGKAANVPKVTLPDWLSDQVGKPRGTQVPQDQLQTYVNAAHTKQENAASADTVASARQRRAYDEAGQATSQADIDAVRKKYPEVDITPTYSPVMAASYNRLALSPDKRPETLIKQWELNNTMSQDPKQTEQLIDQLAPVGAPNDPLTLLNKGAKARLTMANTLGERQAIMKDLGDKVSEWAHTKQMATDPVILNAEAQKSAAQERAKQSVMSQLRGPETAGLEDSMAKKATDEVLKSSKDLGTAQHASDILGQFIQLAKSGNKAANADLPMLSVEALNAAQGFKRVNQTELHQNATMGSLGDKVEGLLGGLTAGQTIPKGLLPQIEAMHDAMLKAGYDQHVGSVNSVNRVYHSQFKPAPLPDQLAVKPIHLKNGQWATPANADQGRQFREQHAADIVPE